MHNLKELLDILDIIPEGKEHALHLDEIAFRLNIHPKVAKEMIRKARLKGAHILSDSCGYWISYVISEMQDYVKRMQKHAFSELHVIMPIINDLREDNGQISLAEYFDKCFKEAEQEDIDDD